MFDAKMAEFIQPPWLGPVSAENRVEFTVIGGVSVFRCKKCWNAAARAAASGNSRPHSFGSRFEYDIHVLHRHTPPHPEAE
jgi:hypothetical protein